ncbi:MAG: (4Fe-4S)-binding protein [Candidatus Abyssobacteria bacterium SURF_5]|uniref:(4Fe-4S)-binding protein n=1 Tax=Abyssobacteria bacterium (strain SURF_5) TaxID=2093360 RepID=A0A3A4P2E5_ABYX5|nr:MAG: (4Fe-4S)-binding protein [Candidatus Abyssubacteria bacterium SURF_5]
MEKKGVRVAVASGKGGTGKTTIATNLAACLAQQWLPVFYVDCDVEEPNGHIFLLPEITKTHAVGVPVPEVHEELCSGCGLCGKTCQFSAIIVIDKQVLTFPELCHGCGGCALVCPEKAIEEKQREVGQIRMGISGSLGFLDGKMRVGEAMSAPLIRAVKENIPVKSIAIIDAPPGTSCPVIEAVKDTDFVLLVTEPTPFGLNDLVLAVEMVREIGLPLGVIINQSDIGTDETLKYCEAEQIAVLLQLPHDRQIAQAYSQGHLAVQALPWFRGRMAEIANYILSLDKAENLR